MTRAGMIVQEGIKRQRFRIEELHPGELLMKVSRIRALRGPNLWSRQTAIEAVVSCSTGYPAGVLSDILDRLRGWFPQINLHKPDRFGTITMAHVLERATLALQIDAGCPVTFSKTDPALEDGIYRVIVEYSEEAVGRLAIELGEALCQAATADIPFDLDDAMRRLRELNEEIRLGPSTGAISMLLWSAASLFGGSRRAVLFSLGGEADSAGSRQPKPTLQAPFPSR